ncbi:hypothetical protein ACFPA8_08020 [Streptomyces ovatisporus]|uniref:Uncharacterized protein n=1 Tax=Streptomyces ovatisporus TaxID=1128682 RepID=A0ABV9A2F7_9ACTN
MDEWDDTDDLEELDPRWEWVDVSTYGDPGPVFLKGTCNHLTPLLVASPIEIESRLCPDCEAQLPAALPL